MRVLKLAFAELVGMFIDDGALALLVLLLILTVGIAAKMAILAGLTGAILLFVGCLLILAESVLRAARKESQRKSGSK